MSNDFQHPYVPRDLSLPDFVPIELSAACIIAPYLLCSCIVVFLIWTLSKYSPKIFKTDRLLMCWWAFSGLTHIILEGYFVFTPDFLKKRPSFYLAELWKEYGKGDSRYAIRNSAVVSVEGITSVLVGPACLLSVYAIATRKPYSYTLQLSISFCQLYGTLVYFLTAVLDGDNFAASPYYYWAYYVIANSFWILIPSLITIRCWKKLSAAMEKSKSD